MTLEDAHLEDLDQRERAEAVAALKPCDACGNPVSPVGHWRRHGYTLCDACHDANPIPSSVPPRTPRYDTR